MPQEGWKDMANKQKLAKMMVDFISEYDFYDWSGRGREGRYQRKNLKFTVDTGVLGLV